MAPSPSAPNSLRIALCMTDEDVVQKVAAMFGMKYHQIKQPNDTWKSAYRVHLKGKKANDLMLLLLPLMSNRRQQQITKALSLYNPNKKSRLNLTDEMVINIYRRSNNKEPYQKIADDYGISYWTVADIKSQKSWKSLTEGVGVE